jgi:hypothetical protein
MGFEKELEKNGNEGRPKGSPRFTGAFGVTIPQHLSLL